MNDEQYMGFQMRLNPDTDFVKNLKKKIKSNSKYCLNKEKGNPDNKCICRDMRERGICECGLYYRVDLDDNWY